MRPTALALALALTLPAAPAQAERRPEKRPWHVPDHIKLQTGGYLGFATVGLGAAVLYDHVTLTGYYGWVPKIVGGSDIHAFALALDARAPRVRVGADLDWVVAYLGAGGLYTRGDGFFTRLPSRYPAGYYPPNSVRAFGVLGTELELRKPAASGFSGHGWFVELCALDLYIHHWAENRDTISPFETLSTAIGYKARLP